MPHQALCVASMPSARQPKKHHHTTPTLKLPLQADELQAFQTQVIIEQVTNAHNITRTIQAILQSQKTNHSAIRSTASQAFKCITKGGK